MDIMQTVSGKRTALLSVSLILSACGGGGGGTAPTPTPTPVVTVQANGPGNQVTGTLVGDNFSFPLGDVNEAAVSATFTLDDTGGFTGLFLTSTTSTSSTTVGFAGDDIAVLTADPDFVTAGSATSRAILSNPKSLAWDYQSFGVWETGLGTPNRTLYAMSAGTPIDTVIPTTGDATFSGKVVGSYINTAGLGHTALGSLSVYADFAGKSLTFTATTNTLLPSNGTTYAGPLPTFLNMTGTAIYNPSINSFSVPLTTAGSDSGSGNLAGSTSGKFYGPGAEELGGVFYLNRSGSLETYTGAYGASR